MFLSKQHVPAGQTHGKECMAPIQGHVEQTALELSTLSTGYQVGKWFAGEGNASG